MAVAASKSASLLFTPDTHEHNYKPVIYIDGVLVPPPQSPVIEVLGVKYDTHFTFAPHLRSLVSRTDKRTGLLKCLSGTDWGCSFDMLHLTYKSSIESVLTYGAVLFYPVAKPSNIALLQRQQNKALRIVTHNYFNANYGHLCNEVAVLPVDVKLNLVCSHFLVSASRIHHSSHTLAW